jgi:hypothetical protein
MNARVDAQWVGIDHDDVDAQPIGKANCVMSGNAIVDCDQ